MMKNKDRDISRLLVIIAMKGDAYTGKSTYAFAIAMSYRCTLISFDDILDSLSPTPPPSPQEAERLVDVAFDIVVKLVRSQLRIGRPTVIDSPLSNPGQLDRLIQLAGEFQSCGNKSCKCMHCNIVIVECKPKDKYPWQLRFNERDISATDRWYKPKEWSDVVFNESIEHYPPGQLPAYVSRLIVDTNNHVHGLTLGIATLDMCMCSIGNLRIFHDQWDLTKPLHPEFSAHAFLEKFTGAQIIKQADPGHDCWDGRHFLQEEESLGFEGGALGCCAACQEPIQSPPAYACKRCNKVAMHKSCAELEEKTVIPLHHLPPFLRIIKSPVSDHEYQSKILQEYRQRCSPCGVAGREFSVNCKDCIWETHLRSRTVPTVLHHEGHSKDHSLCFWITPLGNPQKYLCQACKMPGCYVGYTCLNNTFLYNVHVECALSPRSLLNVHGGHRHHMQLMFSTAEITDDYFCDVCQGPRDPTAWHYSCTECSFVTHLQCI